MEENAEILDLVNEKDEIVGTISRGEMVKLAYKHPKGYVRFAVGFLLNKAGDVWVPTRGLHKSIAPGGLDFSVAEHLLSGESYADAIERAFKEEAGISVGAANLELVGKMPPTPTKPSFEAVLAYRGYSGDDPDFSKDEFTSAQWIPAQELKSILLQGAPSKSALLPGLEMLLSSR